MILGVWISDIPFNLISISISHNALHDVMLCWSRSLCVCTCWRAVLFEQMMTACWRMTVKVKTHTLNNSSALFYIPPWIHKYKQLIHLVSNNELRFPQNSAAGWRLLPSVGGSARASKRVHLSFKPDFVGNNEPFCSDWFRRRSSISFCLCVSVSYSSTNRNSLQLLISETWKSDEWNNKRGL